MEIFAPDLRFHGQSRNASDQDPDAFSMGKFGKDLIETLSDTGFYPVWMVGHSMGARAAVAATMLHPEWIRGLVLVDHPPYVSKGEFRIKFGKFLEDLPTHFNSHALAMKYLQNACPDPSSAPVLSSSIVSYADGGVEFNFDKTNVLRTFHTLSNAPYADWLHDLGQQGKPVLLIRGKRSLFWSGEDWDHSRRTFGQYPSFEFLEVDSAGHGVPFEMPDVFLKGLLRFLQRR